MRPLIRAAKAIYRATPYRPVREFYFKTFCRVVRGKRMRATVDGCTFDLDMSEIIDATVYLGQWEPDVTEALTRYCAPGMTVLDIGANMGAHTMLMGKLVGPTGRVFAFEPTDFAFAKLERNLSLNSDKRITPVKAALDERAAKHQVVDFRASWRTYGGRSDGKSVTDFIRMDDWAESAGVRKIDLIKIDTDGHEFGALAGGMQLLKRSKPVIIIEAVGFHYIDDRTNPFLLLRELGYTFTHARTHASISLPQLEKLLPDRTPAMLQSVNVIAIS